MKSSYLRKICWLWHVNWVGGPRWSVRRSGDSPRLWLRAKCVSFATLTLVDIAPRMDRDGVAKIVGFTVAHAEAGFASVEEAADVIAAYLPHRERRRDLSGLAKNLRQDKSGRWRWHWDSAFIRNSAQTRGERRYERLDEAAARLQLPVHLIRGKSSELISEENAQHFLSLVPHARFTAITGAGHTVAGDRNDLFVEAVLQFLQRWLADAHSTV